MRTETRLVLLLKEITTLIAELAVLLRHGKWLICHQVAYHHAEVTDCFNSRPYMPDLAGSCSAESSSAFLKDRHAEVTGYFKPPPHRSDLVGCARPNPLPHF
jgi:hypothetical protein